MSIYLMFTVDYDTGYHSHFQGAFESEEKIQAYIQHLRDSEEAFYEGGDVRIVHAEINKPQHVNLGY